MPQSFSFNYFGLKCQNTSSNQRFHSLAAAKFAGFKAEKSSQLLDQSVTIAFNDQPPPKLNKTQKLSHNIWQTDTGGRIKHQYLKTTTTIDFTSNNNQLKKINLYHQSHPAFTFLNLVQQNLLKRQLYQNLIKLYIEQALLHTIIHQNQLHCLHASAVEKDKQVTVFCGLNGVGKSTLAQWLVKHKGHHSFADNYVICNQTEAFRSPDTLRLSPQTIKKFDLKADSPFGFGKKQLPQPHLSSNQSASIATIYWVHQGNAWKVTEKNNKLFNHIKHHERIAHEAIEHAPIAHFFSPQIIKQPPTAAYKVLQLGPLSQLESFLDANNL